MKNLEDSITKKRSRKQSFGTFLIREENDFIDVLGELVSTKVFHIFSLVFHT